MLLDTPVFNPDLLNSVIPRGAPKIAKLFEKITELDEKDMRLHKKHFKHMIFTDIASSSYGAKLIASAFVAKGFTPAFTRALGLKSDETLKETSGKNFGLLISKTFGKKSMSTKFKKAEMHKYNERPGNVQGDLMRFIILDQGFKEGIDLFDVKYVHLFEPLVSRADEKQAIGRGTRFCGQKGLEFHPRFGWPLYVFRYDITLGAISKKFEDAKSMFELYLKYSDIDMRRVVFAAELENATIDAAVDKTLTSEIHSFKIESPPPILTPKSSAHSGGGRKDLMPPRNIMGVAAMQNYVNLNFSQFKYPKVKLENLCGTSGGAGTIVNFTPTQDFIRHFFQPSSAYKGMLLFHSVGSGKTCTAIATATTSFEKEGYSILWVTRHTLKSDIWKNMYDQVCSITVKERIESGDLKLPKGGVTGGPMKYVSDQWIEPMSYKQFSNMLLKENRFYEEIVEKNGSVDPLRKTLVIIDEAHKLYAENVTGSEKPQVEILEQMIQNSYKVSGKNSARVLLMTATPYTSDGMEMIKLLNLLRPKADQFPADFDKFAAAYLNKEGYFSKQGLLKYQNAVSGYVSYLNRSQDARNFSHPVLENVHVPISTSGKDVPGKHLDNSIKEINAKIKEIRGEIKAEKAQIKDKAKEVKANCIAEKREKIAACKESVKATFDSKIDKAKADKESALEKCKSVEKSAKKACRDAATAKHKGLMESLRGEKSDALARCNDLKDACNSDKTSRLAELNKKVLELNEYIAEAKSKKDATKGVLKNFQVNNKEMAQNLKPLRVEARALRDELKGLNAEAKELREKIKSLKSLEERKPYNDKLRALNKEIKIIKEPLSKIRANITNITSKKKVARINIGRAAIGDVSQETALANKCFA